MNFYILENFRYLNALAGYGELDSADDLAQVLLELWRNFEGSYPEIPPGQKLLSELAPLGIKRLEKQGQDAYWWWDLENGTSGFGGWFSISAAHFLPRVPKEHKCRRLHGHRFRVRLEREIDSDSMTLASLPQFQNSMRELLKPYQKSLLNNLKGLENPTAELLAHSIYVRAREIDMPLESVEVWETSFSGCAYTGDLHYKAFKDFEVECAIEKNGSYEGRSLLLRLGVESELDQSMGWTMDFARIKELFRPLYQRLDHRCLSDIEGFDLAELDALGEWIIQESSKELPLSFVRIEEEPGKGALVES